MGFIYKIKNDINNKVYIGQTIRNVQNRWMNHLSRARYPEKWKFPLYNAMNKYGVEHFSIELIEECKDEDMDERERYWINYYDSYYNGYNAALGGQDRKRQFSYAEIIEDVKSGKYTKEEVAKKYKCDVKTIWNACNSVGIKWSDYNSRKISKNCCPVVQLDKDSLEPINFFRSKREAAKFISKTHNPNYQSISKAIQNQSLYRGYKWREATEEEIEKYL